MSDDRSDLEEAIDILRNWKGIMPGALVERINRLLARHPEKPTLLPCPFCGGSPAQVGTSYGWVSCTSCNAEGPTTSIPAAVDAWNRRATPASGPVSGGKP